MPSRTSFVSLPVRWICPQRQLHQTSHRPLKCSEINRNWMRNSRQFKNSNKRLFTSTSSRTRHSMLLASMTSYSFTTFGCLKRLKTCTSLSNTTSLPCEREAKKKENAFHYDNESQSVDRASHHESPFTPHELLIFCSSLNQFCIHIFFYDLKNETLGR